MLAPRIIAHLARPLRLLNRRSTRVEKLLQAPLTAQDEGLIREACAVSGGVRLGEFYHWYLQKLIVSRTIRGIDRAGALSLVNSVDGTNYQPIQQIIDSRTGVLVAMPHHAHYIFSMIALAERLRLKRKIYIFYGQPNTHRGNEVFDHLHTVIWGEASNVEVIHDTRHGMAKAIRGLKNGEIVFIMPDVFQKEDHTLVIPFCRRSLSVMMGTAILARKTGAWILPVVSTRRGRSMGFRTLFGERIDYDDYTAGEGDADVMQILDYRIIRRIFDQYEKVMAGDVLYWQNMRQHLAQDRSYREPRKDQLPIIAGMLQSDSDILSAAQVIDLRAKAA